jgi:hypothetical protein
MIIRPRALFHGGLQYHPHNRKETESGCYLPEIIIAFDVVNKNMKKISYIYSADKIIVEN